MTTPNPPGMHRYPVGGNSQLIRPTEYSFEVARIGGDGPADLVERKVSVIAEPACAGADLPGLRAAICRASPAGTVILRSEDPRGAPRRSSAGGGRRPGSWTRVPEPKQGTHTRVARLCPGDTGWWPVTDRRRAGLVKMTQDEQRAFVADWVPIFSLLGPMWFLRLATAAGMGVIYLAVTASMFARPDSIQMDVLAAPPEAADAMRSVLAAGPRSGRCWAAAQPAHDTGHPDSQHAQRRLLPEGGADDRR
jgi:hypothetical protein